MERTPKDGVNEMENKRRLGFEGWQERIAETVQQKEDKHCICSPRSRE